MAGHFWSFYLSFLHRGFHKLVCHLSRVLCDTSVGTELTVNHRMARSNINILRVLNLCYLRSDARYAWA